MLLKRNPRSLSYLRRYHSTQPRGDEHAIRNAVGVQLLSRPLHAQLFGNVKFPPPTRAATVISHDHLSSHGLDPSASSTLPQTSFTLPPLQGPTIDAHFHAIGAMHAEPSLSLAKTLAAAQIPPRPEHWIIQPGWTKYTQEDGEVIPEHIERPDEAMLVFDVETMWAEHPFAIMACAASPTAWYAWISPWLLDNSRPQNQLIPIGSPDKDRIVVGHNVSYDRARVKEEYHLKRSGTRWIDTMALHVAVKGISSHQRPAWMKYRKQRKEEKEMRQESIATVKDLISATDQELDSLDDSPGAGSNVEDSSSPSGSSARRTELRRLKKDMEESLPLLMTHDDLSEEMEDEAASKRWQDITSANSLADVALLHCGIVLPKETRSDFLTCTPAEILASLDTYLDYCATDVSTTHAVYRSVLPTFLAACPSPVTWAGVMAMGNSFLTVNESWTEYLNAAEGRYRELETGVKDKLLGLVNEARQMMEGEKWKDDIWLSQLDWSEKVAGKSRGFEVVKPAKPLKVRGAKQETKKEIRERQKQEGNQSSNLEFVPQWFHKLDQNPSSKSILHFMLPLLMRMTWNGKPVAWDADNGWGYYQTDAMSLGLPFSRTPLQARPFSDHTKSSVHNLFGKTFRSKIEKIVAFSHFEVATLPNNSVDSPPLLPADVAAQPSSPPSSSLKSASPPSRALHTSGKVQAEVQPGFHGGQNAFSAHEGLSKKLFEALSAGHKSNELEETVRALATLWLDDWVRLSRNALARTNNDPWWHQLKWEPVPNPGYVPSIVAEAPPPDPTPVPSAETAVANEPSTSTMVSEPVIWPKWYWELTKPKAGLPRGAPDITPRSRLAPLMLRLSWLGWPLFHSREHGWCFRVPRAQLHSQDAPQIRGKPVDFYDEADEVMRHMNIRGGFAFFKLPHKDGDKANVGSPLTKTFVKFSQDGTMTSPGDDAKAALDMNAQCSYWISARDRVMKQMVVWESEKGAMGVKVDHLEQEQRWGMILPQVITMGTVTRRAIEKTWLTASNAKKNRVGSELKAMVRAPPGYAIVGADVDSEELWISSVMGDAQFGIHGATAIGWMTLEGTKSAGTDLHSKTASILGISRDQAKVFNYSRIYGAGMKHASLLLLQGSASMLPETAQKLAEDLYAATKGKNTHRADLFNHKFWFGGTESFLFNKLEAIALSDRPQTPALGCGVTYALSKEYLPAEFGADYMPSRINWVVQSSGVDYLHLLIVAMEHMIAKYNIDARYLISVHDEVRYLVKEEDKYRAALALQIANLWTRCQFSYRLGMDDLPQCVAFFSAVDVDKILRKEVDMTCVTPSQPNPLPPGESLNIQQVLERTGGGSLWHDQRAMELEPVVQTVPEGYTEPDCLVHRASSSAYLRAQATDQLNEIRMLARRVTGKVYPEKLPRVYSGPKGTQDSNIPVARMREKLGPIAPVEWDVSTEAEVLSF